MEEIWKDVVGYEGHYKVSNNGKIKSIKFNKEKLLKCNKQKDGYVKIILLKDGKSKSFMVHRLVAIAFIENAYNLPKVNHKDENKQNNEVSNLEWCTQKYNINYGVGKIKSANSRKIPVLQMKDGIEIAKFESAKLAGEILGMKNNHICLCCKNKRKTSNGYQWKYAKKEL